MVNICGVDEAGRGPLAGPVTAAAVILPQNFELKGLRDSKKMTERARERCYGVIIEQAIAWSVATASVKEIDRINILRATQQAMVRAVERLSVSPDVVWVDGRDLIDVVPPCHAIIGGDDRHAVIAAASVLAKVTRDRYMLQLAKDYPEYGFERHKGYGTAAHLAALAAHGVTVHHRQSFSPVKRLLETV